MTNLIFDKYTTSNLSNVLIAGVRYKVVPNSFESHGDYFYFMTNANTAVVGQMPSIQAAEFETVRPRSASF